MENLINSESENPGSWWRW